MWGLLFWSGLALEKSEVFSLYFLAYMFYFCSFPQLPFNLYLSKLFLFIKPMKTETHQNSSCISFLTGHLLQGFNYAFRGNSILILQNFRLWYGLIQTIWSWNKLLCNTKYIYPLNTQYINICTDILHIYKYTFMHICIKSVGIRVSLDSLMNKFALGIWMVVKDYKKSLGTYLFDSSR